MNEAFDEKERLLRAVWPPNRRPDFWVNGRLSSAAFKDKNGLSVDRTADRPLESAVEDMRERFHGRIASVSVLDCNSVSAVLKYLPSRGDKYHSEIHGSQTEKALGDLQAFKLARAARLES